MTNELKRLRQALGAPDFQLHEIQREQRLMDAASRWPILRDVAPDTTAPNREINVDLGVKDAEKSAEPAIVRLQTKSAAAERDVGDAARGRTEIRERKRPLPTISAVDCGRLTIRIARCRIKPYHLD